MSVAENLHQLSDQELDNIMEKIQKLLRLRDNAGATVGEVANAGAMIQKLLLQYNLSMEEIAQHQPERGKATDYQKSDRFDLGASSNYRTEWRGSLLNQVARTNFCRAVIYERVKASAGYKGRDATAVVVGKPYNVQVTKDLYEWLAEQVNRLCTKAWTQYHRMGGETSKKIWKTSFFKGAVVEIGARLAEEKRKAEAADANVHALIVLSDTGLQKAYDEFFGSALAKSELEYHWFKPGAYGHSKECAFVLRATGKPCGLPEHRGMGLYYHYRASRQRSRSLDTSAYEAGREAGRQVNLSPRKKVEGGGSEQRRMS